MALSLIEPVREAWLSLLDMPEDLVPLAWIEEAELYLTPPTETPTPSHTSTPTFTLTTTSTSTPSSTLPSTATKTLKPTNSPTPTKTKTAAP